MATTQPIRSSGALAESYDAGTDVQPNVSWSSGPSKEPPASSATFTSSGAVPSSTRAALEANLNPIDKADPRLLTRTLPFANTNTADIAATVVTPAVQDEDADALHNGNILDSTMDRIRTWVHSFTTQRSGADDYSAYADDSTHSHDKHGAGAVDAAKAHVQRLSAQTSSALQGVGSAASNTAAQVSSTVRAQAGELQHRVGDAVHAVGDAASATVQQVKAQVGDFISAHPAQLSLPTQADVSQRASQILPPLAQQASSSYAFLGSFVKQYLATYRDFLVALRRQALPLQAMTAVLLVTHALLPLLFLDKGPARSVLYCYAVQVVLAHLTFFLSGHLRYQFLAHVVFLPMLLSLLLHAGFSEAGQAHQAAAEYEDGSPLKAMLIAPLSLRNYFFVLWLRVVLMVQASLLTLDAVNVLDMLGFSLDTRRGQELQLLSRSVQHMRRSFAHSVAPPPTPKQASAAAQAVPAKQSAPIDEGRERDEVVVQSHEQPSTLRERKPLTAQTATQPHQHPTYSINNQRL